MAKLNRTEVKAIASRVAREVNAPRIKKKEEQLKEYEKEQLRLKKEYEKSEECKTFKAITKGLDSYYVGIVLDKLSDSFVNKHLKEPEYPKQIGSQDIEEEVIIMSLEAENVDSLIDSLIKKFN